MRGKASFPLVEARAGQRVRVKGINGGRRLWARMAALGIYPGVELELLCSGYRGPCLIRIHGSTVSLGAGVSRKIVVEPS